MHVADGATVTVRYSRLWVVPGMSAKGLVSDMTEQAHWLVTACRVTSSVPISLLFLRCSVTGYLCACTQQVLYVIKSVEKGSARTQTRCGATSGR
jgi:hypothetical protein